MSKPTISAAGGAMPAEGRPDPDDLSRELLNIAEELTVARDRLNAARGQKQEAANV